MVFKVTLVSALSSAQAEQKKKFKVGGGGLKGGVPPYFLPICLCPQKYGQVPKTIIIVCLEKP